MDPRLVAALTTLLAALLGSIIASATALYIAMKVYEKQRALDRSIIITSKIGEHYSKIISGIDRFISTEGPLDEKEYYSKLFDLKIEINSVTLLDPGAPIKYLQVVFYFAHKNLHMVKGTKYQDSNSTSRPNVYELANSLRNIRRHYQSKVLLSKACDSSIDLFMSLPGIDIIHPAEEIEKGPPWKR
jgi:hypothetical protein